MTKYEQKLFIETTLENIKRNVLEKLEDDPFSDLDHINLRKLIHLEASQYDYTSNEKSVIVTHKVILKEVTDPSWKRLQEYRKYHSMIGDYNETPRH